MILVMPSIINSTVGIAAITFFWKNDTDTSIFNSAGKVIGWKTIEGASFYIHPLEMDDELGKLHREDGPAVENTDGTKRWYIEGVEIKCKDQEEFEHMMKLKAFW